MKKNTNGSRMPLKTGILFGLAAVLILGGTFGTSRAALTYYSENYSAQIQMFDIGVSLVETSQAGTKDISYRNYTQSGDRWNESTGKLLEDMVPEGETFQLGKPYKEELAVKNSGTIDEYVRVNVYRYWVNEDGTKRTDMDPSLIDLDIDKVAEANGWIIDDEANAGSKERTTLYYSTVLGAGDTTLPFSATLRIDEKAGGKVTREETEEGGVTKIKVTYEYDGARFVLEADADAVQTHSAQKAIKSAWGVDVTVDGEGGPLSLG